MLAVSVLWTPPRLWPAATPSATALPPGCYPFYKTDPFILLECPHVYFCGSAPRFGSKVIRGRFRLLGALDLGCHQGLALSWRQCSQRRKPSLEPLPRGGQRRSTQR